VKFSIGGHTETQAIEELDSKGRNGNAIVKEAKVDGVCVHDGALVEREKDGSYSVAWKAGVL